MLTRLLSDQPSKDVVKSPTSDSPRTRKPEDSKDSDTLNSLILWLLMPPSLLLDKMLVVDLSELISPKSSKDQVSVIEPEEEVVEEEEEEVMVEEEEEEVVEEEVEEEDMTPVQRLSTPLLPRRMVPLLDSPEPRSPSIKQRKV